MIKTNKKQHPDPVNNSLNMNGVRMRDMFFVREKLLIDIPLGMFKRLSQRN